jgi:hypothetical protein
MIVAPSLVRSIRDANLLAIWQSALESLRTADRWIIAGYSLPPEDLAILSILLRAFRGNQRHRKLEIWVITKDHDDGLMQRSRLMFEDRCKFVTSGFEEFTESGTMNSVTC